MLCGGRCTSQCTRRGRVIWSLYLPGMLSSRSPYFTPVNMVSLACVGHHLCRPLLSTCLLTLSQSPSLAPTITYIFLKFPLFYSSSNRCLSFVSALCWLHMQQGDDNMPPLIRCGYCGYKVHCLLCMQLHSNNVSLIKKIAFEAARGSKVKKLVPSC